MTIRVVTNLIIGEGQFRQPLLLGILAEVIFMDSWEFPSIWFIPNPIVSPSIKITLSLFSLCPSLNSTIPSFHLLILYPLSTTPIHSYIQ